MFDPQRRQLQLDREKRKRRRQLDREKAKEDRQVYWRRVGIFFVIAMIGFALADSGAETIGGAIAIVGVLGMPILGIESKRAWAHRLAEDEERRMAEYDAQYRARWKL